MINFQDLIGKPYPIKDVHNNLLGFRTIKKVFEPSNAAGVLIQIIDSPTGGLWIGYIEAEKLLNDEIPVGETDFNNR